MHCFTCQKYINTLKKNYICYSCGEITCYSCRGKNQKNKVFKLCSDCKNKSNKKNKKKSLENILKLNPLHKNREWIYYNLAEINEDKKTIYYWHEKAARAGIPGSMDYLGVLYFKGFPEVGGTDYKKALFWFTLACENHYRFSYYMLGIIYDKGLGVNPDPYRATTIFIYGSIAGNLACLEEVKKRIVVNKGFI